MSFRAVWVLSYEKGEVATLRFSRRYPSVERRAKRLSGPQYVPIPEDCVLSRLLFTELGLEDPDRLYVAMRDDCELHQESHILELHPDGCRGALWPLLTITQGGLIMVCLPLVDSSAYLQPRLSSQVSISQGIAFLSGLQAFLSAGNKTQESDILASRLDVLPLVLFHICPLGTPVDTPHSAIFPFLSVSSPSSSQKQPAWKAGTHKGRSTVSVSVTETVRSMQYGNHSKQDLWDVYGTVMCKCEVEGTQPNITVTLSLPPNGSPLQDILAHPCVNTLDTSTLTASSMDYGDASAFSGPYKFPFSPPLEPFRLCSYTSQVPVPPVLGSYQLKEDDGHLQLNVLLKLHESVTNSFEYCEAHLPFFNRCQMGTLDVKVTSGQVEVSKEKNLLVWILGQKFPKAREVTLEGAINFSGQTVGPTDPLCTDGTAYVKLYFRIPDLTLSGCCVDQHSVQVYSSTKPRVVTSRDLVSSEYYIWNSTGHTPMLPGAMMM
ncbi:AP-5 complex subunit mu-1 isoform X2 [Sardina pilchardus]|uniref:AP-5 complex subunit mu-1 isoform X2 n=1 Tax=Sardina pilchardus TaxID=27697 RepID=UPI002E1329B1